MERVPPDIAAVGERYPHEVDLSSSYEALINTLPIGNCRMGKVEDCKVEDFDQGTESTAMPLDRSLDQLLPFYLRDRISNKVWIFGGNKR